MSTSLLDAHATAAVGHVVEECANQPAGTDTVFEVMDDLQQLVGCDWLMFTHFDTQGRRLHHAQRVDWGERELASPEELETQDHEPFWRWYWHCEPAALPDRVEAPVVLTLSEFYTARQWAQHPMFREWKLVTDPATDELLVSYPDIPGLTHRLLFGREGGRRFDERERFLMKVLRLVRLGMANKQIARAMKISTGTVRKHLENIYERLGVQSRTEAVHEAALDDQPGAPGSGSHSVATRELTTRLEDLSLRSAETAEGWQPKT